MAVQLNRALVIGGGFSGLSAAIMLARAGMAVDLIEKSQNWTMDGAGISLGSATLRALSTLGVLDRFLADGYGGDGTDVRAPSGAPITQFPTPRLVAPDIPGNGAIMRPTLGRILAGAMAAAGVKSRLGVTAHNLDDDGEGVNVTFSNGGRDRYDLVVGADGIHSTTRRQLFPDSPVPRFSGQGAWRAVVPRPADVVRTTVWIGAPAKVGVNPISQHEMYLFVNEAKTFSDRVPDAELLPRLRALIEPFTDPLLKSVRSALGERSLVFYRPMDNLLVPRPWHRGRVVLIGDAVHATTPHLAAGAGIGIEDAIVLAEELATASTLDSGLTAFEDRRWERCRMVVENSARLGELEAAPGTEEAFTQLQAESMRALAQPI
ncbi:FAD-dependent oxidoreductase [Leifsonia kafniensis]|uniref:FAD-dependent oxidoreductase n=1 Tax=Leifsonia kafniensis TaxID=475957 RepID=UPI0031ED854F